MKALLINIVLLSTAMAQVADKANSGYKTPEGRERVAQTLIAPGRDAKQKPVELVQAMELQPGMVVADIGTGAGYMLPFLSRAVGAKGRVLAEDIQDDFLAKAHHYDYPEKMLAGIRKGLKPGGRLVIVEYYKRKSAMANGKALEHIRLDAPDVIKEIEANGFHLESQREHIKDSQYMLTFSALK